MVNENNNSMLSWLMVGMLALMLVGSVTWLRPQAQEPVDLSQIDLSGIEMPSVNLDAVALAQQIAPLISIPAPVVNVPETVIPDMTMPDCSSATCDCNTPDCQCNAPECNIPDVNIPNLDLEKLDKLCDLTEGCDGQWDVNNFMRGMFLDNVLEELEDRNYKALFDGMKNLVDIEEREDINSISLHDDNGEITVNQGDYDALYDANDDTIVKGEFVIEVDYFDDEDNVDRTRWFKVTATISDVEDSINFGDVVIDSVKRVSEHYEFD